MIKLWKIYDDLKKKLSIDDYLHIAQFSIITI